MKTFEEFAAMLHPDLLGQFKLYCMSDDELIGKKVVSIRGGFSGGPGTKCYISKIQRPYNDELQSPDNDRISFLGRDGYEKNSKLGWQVRRNELFKAIKLDET